MLDAPITSGANFFIWIVAFAVAAGAALTIVDLMSLSRKDKRKKQLPSEEKH